MNLPQLYYFKKLAEVQHYTRAAKELYITQPTLSNSISQLERELGVPLFERENRAVHLTRYGREFYKYITQALNMLDKGIDVAHEHAGSLSGSIEIGTIYTIQGDYLPALIAGYRAQYGDSVTTNIYQGLSRPLIEGLCEDRYEIAFAAFVPDKPQLTFVPMFTQQLVVIMQESNPLAQKDSISFSDLQGVSKLYSYPAEAPIGAEVAALIKPHGLTITPPFYNDEITLASVIDSDEEAVGLSLNTIGLVPFKDKLVTKPIAGVPVDFHPIYMVYKTSAFKTRTLETFIEHAKSFVWTDVPRLAIPTDEEEGEGEGAEGEGSAEKKAEEVVASVVA